MQIAKSRVRGWLLGGAGIAILVGILWISTAQLKREDTSVPSTTVPVVSANTSTSRSTAALPAAAEPAAGGATAGSDPAADSIGRTEPYPVNLDALRGRLPGNRYWALGAPTSDPAVAQARADRARRDNTALGHILANEASPEDIRAYYAERRAISRDYLELAQLVLAEQGAQLPERDRGMFELSVNLHRARLQQIDRDEADALARRGKR